MLLFRVCGHVICALIQYFFPLSSPLQVGLAAASALAEEEAPQLQVLLFLTNLFIKNNVKFIKNNTQAEEEAPAASNILFDK